MLGFVLFLAWSDRMLLDGPATTSKSGKSRGRGKSGKKSRSGSKKQQLPVSTTAQVSSITTGANDGVCAASQGRPMDLINQNVQSYQAGGQGQFAMHDHVYTAPGVPDPSRAWMQYTYEARVIVSSVKVLEHTNGISTLEGFAGDDANNLVSVGVVAGSLGVGHSTSELQANIFSFPYPRAGKYFKVVIRGTPLPNGYAFCTSLTLYLSLLFSLSLSAMFVCTLAFIFNASHVIHLREIFVLRLCIRRPHVPVDWRPGDCEARCEEHCVGVDGRE